MKSKISFFNAAVFKRDLRRGAPLWGIYLLIWLVAMPMSLISQRTWRGGVEMRYQVLEAAVASSQIVPFFYGLAVACLLFACLYRSRSANFFAALPIRREAFFATKYLTGLAFLLLPNLVVAAATVLAGLCMGVNLVGAVLRWLAAALLGHVFYFSFAALCAMVVGHLAALPLLYTVLNFTAPVLEGIVRYLLDAFVYGFSTSGDFALLFLSPLAYTQIKNGGLQAHIVYGKGVGAEHCYLDNWRYLLLLAAAGVAFALLAFWLYRRRPIESAGDVIAIRRLKPVFLYCFTAGCSLVIGWVLASMLVRGASTANFLPILACLLAGAVIGFFAGEMMLRKSLRVFRRRSWANCAVACAVIVAALFCVRFDLFGFSRYVPAPENVAAVSLNGERSTGDSQFIARVTALHQEIISQRSQTERTLQDSWGPALSITYQLQDGRTVARSYQLPVFEAEAQNPDSMIRQYENLYNDPDYIVLRTLPADYTEADIARGYATYLDEAEGNVELYLSAAQTYQLLKTAVEPDLRTTNLGVRRWTNNNSEDTPATLAHVYLQIEFERQSNFKEVQYLGITADAVRTIQALKDLGVPEDILE